MKLFQRIIWCCLCWIPELVVAQEVYSTSSKYQDDSQYHQKLAAARKLLPKDAAKSIEQITRALETIDDQDRNAKRKNAKAYELLGDVYRFWKQPDLAERNYKESAGYQKKTVVSIKLGQSQLEGHRYNVALATFQSVERSRISVKDKIKVYAGLGDGYRGVQQYALAVTNYKKALQLTEHKNFERQRITLQTKLGALYQKQGNTAAAENLYDQSLILANKQDKKTAARQKNIAADFYNKNNSYDKEITLRREVLKAISEDDETPTAAAPAAVMRLEDEAYVSRSMADSSTVPNINPVSPQVQNYKIAKAFAAQADFDEAIGFLNESIKEAEKKNDLVVQKDATRKLGEVYRQKGELKKAEGVFENYEAVVDKLYLQKEQEIAQATRFVKELTTKQNRITILEKDRELTESKYQLALTSQALGAQRSLQQELIIYALIGLSLLLLFAGYLMYRNMQQQRYANNLLALKSLRSQMNPHFIFNALNSVNTFIATNDERAANKYLTDFSLLMRAVLENSEEDFIPLAKEVELLERYIQLEHFRFQNKFDYEIKVAPDIVMEDYSIPPMVLQPYIENAVWHGLRYKAEKGWLRITFSKAGRHAIRITVADNGIGRETSRKMKTKHQKNQQSKGMSTVKDRIQILNTMYKDRITVAISDLSEDGKGTKVTVLLQEFS